MTDSDVLRQLAAALDDISMHLNLLALLPWTVHVDHVARRAEEQRRRSVARLLTRIPVQRLPIDSRMRARR